MDFPICGSFISKRGVGWKFRIYSDLSVEQYHSSVVRCNGGYKTGRDIFSPKVTNECAKFIEDHYGIIVKK